MVQFSEKQLLVVDLSVVILTAILLSFDYLLFHSFVECLCAIVGLAVVARLWQQRHIHARPFVCLLAFTLITVAGVDVLHLLAFRGMAIFDIDELNVATQLWIVSRYIFAFGLLGAVMRTSPKGLGLILFCAAALCSVVAIAVFAGLFPAAYQVGEGLTQFKVMSEYIIIGVLIAAILRISFRQTLLSQAGNIYLIIVISLAVLSELMFTLYLDVYGLFNFLGHILKLASNLLLFHLFQFHSQWEQ